MMKTELKVKLHQQLTSLLAEVEAISPQPESLEWYLANQVRKYVSALDAAGSAQDVENCTAVFSRFCTESMDWDTALYKRCAEATALGFKLAKM